MTTLEFARTFDLKNADNKRLSQVITLTKDRIVELSKAINGDIASTKPYYEEIINSDDFDSLMLADTEAQKSDYVKRLDILVSNEAQMLDELEQLEQFVKACENQIRRLGGTALEIAENPDLPPEN